MNQQRFIELCSDHWKAFAEQLEALEGTQKKGQPNAAAFPGMYRRICHDLALAKQRRFDAHLVDQLNNLALRGHQILYRPKSNALKRLLDFCREGFPRAVRREWRLVVFANVLFYGAALAIALGIQWRGELVYAVMGPEQVSSVESMYDPTSEHHLKPRGLSSDSFMFGFYIRNNMTAGFRTFAGGIFFGVGSLFFLLFNALFLGAVAGHLSAVGFGHTLFPFVIGHGSFELTALVLAGTAGMRMGWALLAPGSLRLGDALLRATKLALPLVYGSTGMLFIAAIIEAYWSSSQLLPASVKYSVGAVLWLFVALYFVFAGRPRET